MNSDPFSFKNFADNDIDETFFNQDEFADIMEIEDQDISVVVDEIALQKYNADLTEGLAKGDVLFFVPVKLVEEIYEEQIIWYKNKRYTVDDVKEDLGVYRVVLVGYQS